MSAPCADVLELMDVWSVLMRTEMGLKSVRLLQVSKDMLNTPSEWVSTFSANVPRVWAPKTYLPSFDETSRKDADNTRQLYKITDINIGGETPPILYQLDYRWYSDNTCRKLLANHIPFGILMHPPTLPFSFSSHICRWKGRQASSSEMPSSTR